MKSFKNIIATIAVALLSVASINAANQTFTCANGATTNVFQSGLVVSQFSIANATATPTALVFFDSGSGQNTYSNNSYVTFSYVTQNITNSYTNYFGVVNSNVYSGLVQLNVTNAASTNLFNMPLALIVPTNTTILVDGTYRFGRGMFVTNGAASVTVSVTYQQ